jgi:DNA polymerase III subunit chi
MAERVDFYILTSTAREQLWSFACRLTAKAYQSALSVVILSESDSDARIGDELLWTFNDRAFVPHQIGHDAQSMDSKTPVHLVYTLEHVARADLLVNLSDRQPLGLDRFARIAEVIDSDARRRQLGRERFKAYRDQKLTLETHQLSEGAEPAGV